MSTDLDKIHEQIDEVKPIDLDRVREGFLSKLDMRRKETRVMITVMAAYIEDLGGFEKATFAQIELIRRAATLSALAMSYEERLMTEGELTVPEQQKYLQITKTLSDISTKLKAESKDPGEEAKDITAYLKKAQRGQE